MDECAVKKDLKKTTTAVTETAKTYQAIKQKCPLRKEEASLSRTRNLSGIHEEKENYPEMY